jgi:hypothetical protein
MSPEYSGYENSKRQDANHADALVEEKKGRSEAGGVRAFHLGIVGTDLTHLRERCDDDGGRGHLIRGESTSQSA